MLSYSAVIDGGYLSKETNEYEVEKIVDKCFCKERVRRYITVRPRLDYIW